MTIEVTAFFTNDGVPLTSPGDLPTIRIRRIDTQALVVTDSNMTEIGDGNYSFTFADDSTLEYTARADGDPTVSGQVTPAERYKSGALSDEVPTKVTEVHQRVSMDGANPTTENATDTTITAAGWRITRTDVGGATILTRDDP